MNNKSVIFFCSLAVFLSLSCCVLAQTCKVPFSIKFSDTTTTSINVKWSDTNTTPLGWEIELVKKGNPRAGVPSFPLITAKEFSLTELEPSTSYELYIRTVCGTNSRSNWNVAIPFNTVLKLPTLCSVNVPLKDNGTETLLLEVQEKGVLGQDVFLQKVNLIVSHDWPADLKIILESPKGQQLLLSNHNGTVTDDFGDINDTSCMRFTTFSPDACLNLKDSKPPYIGTYRPDGHMDQWTKEVLDKGYWKLIFFDRAFKDAGALKYADIIFSREKCLVPQNFRITSSDKNAVSLAWDPAAMCNTLKITISENNVPSDTIYVECDDLQYTLLNLLPNTRYDFTITSLCSFNTLSQESCSIQTSTSCEAITVQENFDDIKLCTEGCAAVCPLLGSMWYNVAGESTQDWISWAGKTDTDNTGPSGDINQSGKYVYIENNPSICGTLNAVMLQSRCISIKSNESGCDMSFYYHMYGNDIQTLILEISVDNGQTWQSLFSRQGSQGDEWKRITIPLSSYHNQACIFRFTGLSASGPLGDIGLDQIEFYGSTVLTELYTYYPDKDGDDAGVEMGKIEICDNTPPTGYASQKGDCDDFNPLIHPKAIEIQCNAVDENCNGNSDDSALFNPIQITQDISNASCNGSLDGSIHLSLSGGSPPYSLIWNNGMSGQSITGLKSGVYFATISDAGLCKTITPFFQINETTNLNIISTSIIKPTCSGKSDGTLTIEHNNDHSPYTYLWSSGNTSKNLINVPEGTYSVTVTDSKGCNASLEKIILASKLSVLTDIRSISQPLCFGQSTGSIELLTINGSPPYQYLWNTGKTTDKITGLNSGQYTCIVSDANGCKVTFSTSIVAPPPIEGKLLSTENVRCFGENNGSIKTNISGGKPPYTFLWNNFTFTDDIYEVAAGKYYLTVTDANGCNFEMPEVTIMQPSLFRLEVDSIKEASCILGKNGYISLTSTGGNPSYNFAWNHTGISNDYFDDLRSGNYSVTAYDQLGCKASIPNIFIPYKNIPIIATLNLVQDNKCFSDTMGIIAAEVANGKNPFDYNWSLGLQYFKNIKRDTISSLASGKYTLTITDADGCTGVSDTITIEDQKSFTYAVTDLKNNICHGDSSGAIAISIQGGIPPIGVLWNGGLFSGSQINNLPTGNYEGVAIDANDCTLVISTIVISSESDIKMEAEIVNERDNMQNGKICLNVLGGKAPYTYKWSNSGLSQRCLENLTAGTYQVTVTDANECNIYTSFIVESVVESKEQVSTPVQIFPNPASENVLITAETDITSVDILQTDGLSVISMKNIHGSKTIIDLMPLSAGNYFIKVKTQTITKYFRLIKI